MSYSSAIAPVRAKDFDVSKIRYGPLKKTNMSKSVYVNYGGEKCVIQFPIMHVPYGISDSSTLNKDKKDPSSKLPNYTMNVSFKGIDENVAVKTLFTKLQAIEEKIKSDVFANRLTWLNDNYDNMETLVSRLFSSNIQLDKDKETKAVLNRYPPTFRAKVPSDSQIDDEGVVQTTFKFDASDMDNNEINFGDVINKIKGAKAQLIVQLMGLWFAGGKYGCTWKIISGRFQVPLSVKYTYVEDSDDEAPAVSKKNDSDDEDEIVADIPVAEEPAVSKAPAVSKTPAKTEIPPSDDDEEEDEEEDDDEEEALLPPPPPPKKTVKKAVSKK